MLVHGGIPLGEAWGFLRDHMRGTTPYAEEQLAECRRYEPPSKAHLKRLRKLRLLVVPARPQPEPAHCARAATAELMSLGLAVAREAAPNHFANPARPEPRNYPVSPPVKRGPALEKDYECEYARLDKDQMVAMYKAFGNRFQPTHERIIRTWRTVEAWEKAIDTISL